MLRVFLFITLLLSLAFGAKAQEHINFSDTFHIEELSVLSPVSGKYQAGVSLQKFSTKQLESVATGSIEQLISRFSPVYVKSDAGGLSTIRVRGTSADHTAVLVGGLNINSLTLGSANFSNIPIYLFDDITMQLGGSSAENGSGSIGAAIKLGLANRWTRGVGAEATASMGSFGQNMGGVKLFVGNGKFESATRAYFYQKENNFTFTSSKYDFEQKQYLEDTQRFAAVDNKGILQEFNYKIDKKEKLTSFIWYEHDKHEAQPNMPSNLDPELKPYLLEDKNLRTWAQYDNYNHKIGFKLGAGAVQDLTIDHTDPDHTIGTNRIVSEAEARFSIARQAHFKTGAKHRYIVPKVYSYAENLTEQWLDAYLSYHQTFAKRIKLAVNLRQQWVTNFNAPFTPSIGLDILLLRTDYAILSLTNNASKSYRIPTFNDRYWGTQGNPNLKPEIGNNLEYGLKYTYCGNIGSLHIQTQFFRLDVDNWLMWVQRSQGWVPDNVLRVVSKGAEFTSDMDFTFGEYALKAGLNYTFNIAERKASTSETDKIGQQLEYVPMHLFNLWAEVSYHKFSFASDAKYTGERFHTQSGTLDAYTLVNAQLIYRTNLKRNALHVALQANNLFNTEYQNQYLYAMPGRNFAITANWKFK